MYDFDELDVEIEFEPTSEELEKEMEDIEDWSLMVCVSCKHSFDLLDSITSDGCKCPYCGKFHGDLI